MRVLVAGCGYVGRELAERLVAGGHEAWGLSRRPAALPSGVVPLAADLTDRATLRTLPPRLDAIVYAAAASGPTEVDYRAAYLDGPRHLLAALDAAGQGPRRVIHLSSTGVYPQRDGSWVDEDSPAEPSDPMGRIMREGERAVLDGPFPATVLRLAGIYGPGRTLWIDRVRDGSARRPPAGTWTNRIHRDDAARAIGHLLALEAPLQLYLGVDDEPAELAEVLDYLAARLGTAPPPPDPEALTGDPMRGRGTKRCSNRRLRASGFVPLYPTFREGYGSLLASP
ncbi:MAG: SDR family oxidoreductase [Acidobacteria bacterium]|jgi:nucleoside-diphosphate-sugar epimerase|nr:SDR family oxidoreductase [Acidobacteriota bacterium]